MLTRARQKKAGESDTNSIRFTSRFNKLLSLMIKIGHATIVQSHSNVVDEDFLVLSDHCR